MVPQQVVLDLILNLFESGFILVENFVYIRSVPGPLAQSIVFEFSFSLFLSENGCHIILTFRPLRLLLFRNKLLAVFV